MLDRYPGAQQLAIFASLPPVVVLALMSFNVILASVTIALSLAAVHLALDGLGWRAVRRYLRPRASHHRSSELKTSKEGTKGERSVSDP